MKYDFMLELSENNSLGKLLTHIKRDSIVLEFGCAAGRMTKYMKENMNCRVYIVEYDAEAFQRALQYAEDGICADIMKFEWVERFVHIQFDYVIFADVLEHLYNPVLVLKKAKGLLKNDGRVLFSVPNISNNDIVAKLFMGKFEYTETGLLDDTHIRFFTRDNIISLCEKSGLAITDFDYTVSSFGKTEQFKSDDNVQEVLDNRIFEILRNKGGHGLVYQYIVESGIVEYTEGIGEIEKSENCLVSKRAGSIYFDRGSGFSESDKLEVYAEGSGTGAYILNETIVLENVNRFRYDPIEKEGCILKKLSVEPDNINIKYSPSGQIDNNIFFLDDDPQIIFEPEGLMGKSVCVCIKFEVVANETEKQAFRWLLEDAEKRKAKYDRLSEEFTTVKNNFVELEMSFAELTGKYDNIVNSMSWKVTGPLRKLKNIFKVK